MREFMGILLRLKQQIFTAQTGAPIGDLQGNVNPCNLVAWLQLGRYYGEYPAGWGDVPGVLAGRKIKIS
ncbi:hypothetical protein [Noviherbaspirillum autotrophicum]|uniref:hypothetical protein n=1 Tax=Noviherbaspirillum autotrophicum TaxID=709839 RepID=UPI0012FDAB61|nr:hypothetical protein [Noviherbaspirillum autotrophicum]